MACEQIIMAQNSELVLDFKLYSAIAAIAPDDATLNEEGKKHWAVIGKDKSMVPEIISGGIAGLSGGVAVNHLARIA